MDLRVRIGPLTLKSARAIIEEEFVLPLTVKSLKNPAATPTYRVERPLAPRETKPRVDSQRHGRHHALEPCDAPDGLSATPSKITSSLRLDTIFISMVGHRPMRNSETIPPTD